MAISGRGGPDWTVVDEGWGRRAVDFATLSEPGNCREYVAVQHRLGVGAPDRLLDVACGSGLAIELAALRGAECAGVDASRRLVAVARDRSPAADMRGHWPPPAPPMRRSSMSARPRSSRRPLRRRPRRSGTASRCARRSRWLVTSPANLRSPDARR